MSQKERTPVVLIFGPTATGKTGLLSSPIFNNTEIINADSMQVYVGMNIGTAKPDKDFLTKVKHHLIDIREPSKQFNAGDFVSLADEKTLEIYKRRRLPVICGGTGFYFKNFIYGMPHTPKPDEEIRKKLQHELQQNGLSSLYEKLFSVDPVSAGRIDKNDTYRILRALEVFYTLGKPLSEYKIPLKPREGYDFHLIGLKRERAELYQRINSRVELMFEQGLISEIEKLKSKGYTEADPGMRAIGYKEFFQAEKNSYSDVTLRELIKRNSRRYAKRQITWFKQLDGIHWYHPDDIDGISSNIKSFAKKYLPSFG